MTDTKKTVYDLIPKLGQLRDDVLFGDVWEQTDLSKRDRRPACLYFSCATRHEWRSSRTRDRA